MGKARTARTRTTKEEKTSAKETTSTTVNAPTSYRKSDANTQASRTLTKTTDNTII